MAGKEDPDAIEADLTKLHLDGTAPAHEFSKPWKNSDAVLVVEGENLHVHRVILEVASPVFQTMFSRRAEGEHGNESVCLANKNVSEFVDFLRQVYPQFPDTLTLENIGHIYANAEEFEVANVLATCKMFLSSQELTRENVSKILIMAQQCKADEARQRCCHKLQYLTTKEAEKVVSFDDLDAQSLREILLPRNKRLETCLQKVIPQLLGAIDLAMYSASKLHNYETHSALPRPKLCSLHYDVHYSIKRAVKNAKPEERLTCESCLSMLAGMTDAHFSKLASGGFKFDENVKQILPEMSELVNGCKSHGKSVF